MSSARLKTNREAARSCARSAVHCLACDPGLEATAEHIADLRVAVQALSNAVELLCDDSQRLELELVRLGRALAALAGAAGVP